MRVYTQKPSTYTVADRVQFDASFGPYIRFLRAKMDNIDDIRAKFYKYIIGKFERRPELLQSFTDTTFLEQHDDLIQLMRMSLLPLAAHSHDFMMALAFMKPSSIFYCTEPFRKSLIDEHVQFNTQGDEMNNLRYLITVVMEKCYNTAVEVDHKIIKQAYNREKHIIKHHHLIIDSRFIEVHSVGEFPEFSESWLDMLNAPDEEFLELVKVFPLERFTFEGFCILYVEDVSKEVAINDLKSAMLDVHSVSLQATLNKVEAAIRELLNDSRLKVGVTPFFKINGKLVYDKSFVTKCIVVQPLGKGNGKGVSIDDIYNQFLTNPEPHILSHIDEALIREKPSLSGLLLDDIKSFMAYPIKTKDGLLGVFEIGSVEHGAISHKTVDHLQHAFPIITDLIYFMIKSFDDKVDQLVKEKFTSLQQSVEWKFNEVAWEYLVNAPDQRNETGVGNVVFEQVYPIYGAVDIRNSSTERNIAARKDYVYQLMVTKELLDKTAADITLPLLEGLQYKCEQFIELTSEVLSAEDELYINDFLDSEIVSFLKYLSQRYPQYEPQVKHYLKNADDETGTFFFNRRAYETALQQINKGIVSYFEEEAQKLQEVYPFYFEKYRSDGVEYNIYIGQSIAPTRPFESIYLKNLRLWQVRSMAHIARLNYRMIADMPLPLQTTQLILVHSHPIDISFRKDERRFDVEGSYNIRYEIIKKRIDKVRIKETFERLTQPDHIAIVYTNVKEVDEYLEHIKFLQNKGMLEENVEMLDLEELQGVSGLKAIRVAVKYQP